MTSDEERRIFEAAGWTYDHVDRAWRAPDGYRVSTDELVWASDVLARLATGVLLPVVRQTQQIDVSNVLKATRDCGACPAAYVCRHVGTAVEQAAKLAVIDGVIAVLRAMPCPAPHEAVCGTVERYEIEAKRIRGDV